MPKQYGFLNCGVTGPFLPTYLPPTFDWFDAFARRLDDNVKLVGAYLHCTDSGNPSGLGPKVEG